MPRVDDTGAVDAGPRRLPPRTPIITPAPPSPLNPIDEQYTYSTYGPSGPARSSFAPSGGTVNWAAGPDPNGYYWVDDGTAGGYWWRPDDGAEWRAPATPQPVDPSAPVTYAPVVHGSPPPGGWGTTGPFTGADGAPAGFASDLGSGYVGGASPENMAAFDLAYSNQRPGVRFSDQELLGFDQGWASAIDAAERDPYGDPVDVSPYTFPQGYAVGPSPLALPEQDVPGGATARQNALDDYLNVSPEEQASLDMAYNSYLTSSRRGPEPLPAWANEYYPDPERIMPGARMPGSLTLDDPRFINPGQAHVQDEQGRWLPEGGWQYGSPFQSVLPKPWIDTAADWVGRHIYDVPAVGQLASAAQLAWRFNPLVTDEMKQEPLAELVTRNFLQNVTSPVGLATLPLAASPAGLAANITGEIGAALGQTAAQGVGAPGWVQGLAALGGGVAGGLAVPTGGGTWRHPTWEPTPPPSPLRAIDDLGADFRDLRPVLNPSRADYIGPLHGPDVPPALAPGVTPSQADQWPLFRDGEHTGWTSSPGSAAAANGGSLPPSARQIAQGAPPPHPLTDVRPVESAARQMEIDANVAARQAREAAAAAPAPAPLAQSVTPAAAPSPAAELHDAVGSVLGDAPVVRPATVPEPEPVRAPIPPREAPPPPAAVTPTPTTRPSGAVVASTAKAEGVDVVAVRKGPRGTLLEGRVTVDGVDAGSIRRTSSTDKFEAYYRTPDGNLAPVPRSADDFVVFTGDKTQAKNAVANAYRAGGKVEAPIPANPRGYFTQDPGSSVRYRVQFEDYADEAAWRAKDPRMRQVVRDAPFELRGEQTSRGLIGRKRIPAQRAAADVAPAATGDVPSAPRPRATPEEAAPAAGPLTTLEAQLDATLAAVRANGGVMPSQAALSEAQDRLARGATAKLPAAKPVFHAGDVVRNRQTGEVFEVASAGEKGRGMTISPQGSRGQARHQVLPGNYRKYEVVEPSVPVSELTDTAVIRMAERRGLLDDPALRKRLHASPDAPETRAAVDRLRQVLEADMSAEQAAARARVQQAAAAIQSPTYRAAVGRASVGQATDGEVAALERIETAVREAAAEVGLDESFPNGHIPHPNNAPIAEGEDILGAMGFVDRETADALAAEEARSRVVRGRRAIGRAAVEATNAPRTIKANLDLSFIRRQGGALNVGVAFVHPKNAPGLWRATGRDMWQALRHPSTAAAIQAEIESVRRPWLYIAPLEGTAKMSLREEANLGGFVLKGTKNPLRITSNANIVYLNRQRADFYDMVVAGWKSAGKEPTNRELKFLANFVNHATGRGTAKWLDEFAPALSVGLFSPRYTVSRFQLLADPFLAPTWRTRWLAAKVAGANLAMQAATAMAVGTLLSAAGFSYETDWRSSDFGRIKVKTPTGTGVFDTTSGLNSPIRFIAQLATGSYKGQAGIKDRPQWETMARYLRSKASPLGGETMDWFFRQIPGLQDLEYTNERGGLGTLPGLRNLPWAADVANMFAPISLDNAVRYLQMANTPKDFAITAGLIAGEIFGDSGDFRGLSKWELRDKEIAADPELAAYGQQGRKVRGYDDLNDAGKLRARQKYPLEAMSSAGKLRAEQKQFAEDEMNRKLAGVADVLANSRDPLYKGSQTYGEKPGEKAREKVKDIQREYSAQLDLIYRDAGKPPPGIVQRWREVIEKNTWPDGSTVDWAPVDRWVASLSSAERKELDDYLAISRAGKSGIVREIADAAAAIDASGYWDTDERAWKSIVDSGMFSGTERFEDYYAFRRDWISKRTDAIVKDQLLSPSAALEQARKEFEKTREYKAFETQKEAEVLDWALKNREVAKTAAYWDYYTPGEKTKGFLATGDPTAIVTRQQEIEATKRVNNAAISTPSGDSRFEDWQARAWTAYADANKITGPDGQAGSAWATYDQFSEAGGVIEGGAGWKDNISKAEYDKNPRLYLRVQTGTNKDGSASYSYINPAGKAEVEAILALYRADPEAVKEAVRLGLPGFKKGSGGNLSKAELTWLAQNGVVLE